MKVNKNLLTIILILFFVLVACNPNRIYKYDNVYALNGNPFTITDTLCVVKDTYGDTLEYQVMLKIEDRSHYGVIDGEGNVIFYNPVEFSYIKK